MAEGIWIHLFLSATGCTDKPSGPVTKACQYRRTETNNCTQNEKETKPAQNNQGNNYSYQHPQKVGKTGSGNKQQWPVKPEWLSATRRNLPEISLI
jgi:hypothetical protein